ncbi:MAG: hypothetical protein M1813_009702 [Trichoglossum hirsutum]|nr:MAG: hypothetical protein M1813_009702 [Trichoglossum hirsutum]
MDVPEIEVVKLSGERLSLKKSLIEVVEALEKDGCLILSGATDLTDVERILAKDLCSPDSVRRDIFLNKAVKAVLFSARREDFRITSYIGCKFGSERGEIGRDWEWKEMAALAELVGVNCTHLGGDKSVSWVIEVDKGFRGEATENMLRIEANGGDMYNAPNLYICVLLIATKLHLQSLAETVSSPRPEAVTRWSVRDCSFLPMDGVLQARRNLSRFVR